MITKEKQDCVVGKKVTFTYNGKSITRGIKEVVDVIHGTWCGDLGYEDDNDDNTDSFLIHGDTSNDNMPMMKGLVIQYDSNDGTRHGYISHIEIIKKDKK